MSDNDSSSEDDDYQPSKAEVHEADAEAQRQKRRKLSDAEEALHLAKAGRASTKADDLWQQLKGSSRSDKRPSLSVTSISNTSSRKSVPAADREWMRQLGIHSYSAPSHSIASRPTEPKTSATSIDQTRPLLDKPAEGKSADLGAASRALAAVKAASNANPEGQVAVTETRRFAGKNIQVGKFASQEEADKLKEKEKKSGIDAVLASLEAAKKVNVLDKSRDDWGQFKKTDGQVEAELEAYKKSGGKYLDKVDFLKRTELREYEAERDQRLAGDIRSRGRS